MTLDGLHRLRRIVAHVGFAAFAWAVVVWLSRGLAVQWGGISLTSRQVDRPLIAAALCAGFYFAAGRWRRQVGRAPAFSLTAAAWTLAVAVGVFAFANRTGVAGGADSYGYLSQAERWIDGRLKENSPVVPALPWANRGWIGTELGYRPWLEESSPVSVPTYAPGLPLLLAGTKMIAGHHAMFLIFPIAAAGLVLATFWLGRRLCSPGVGFAACALVAASPVVLFMSAWPMTDVLTAALWTIAAALLLKPSRRAAAAAGFAAGAALLVRPNLAPVAALIGAWAIARDWRDGHRSLRTARSTAFALAALPAVIAVMAVNRSLYGSPLQSGYGSLSEVMSLANGGDNLIRYLSWISSSQSPLFLIAFVPLMLPIVWMWRDEQRAFDAAVLTAISAGTLLCYLFYFSYEAWWFLRFLLPMWPGLAIGIVWLLSNRGAMRWWGAGATAALACFGLWFAHSQRIEGVALIERRFVIAAELAREYTPPASVILSRQHSGSVRYYGSRMSLRLEAMPADAFDQAMEWLRDHGMPPYILVDDDELPALKERFASSRYFANMSPVVELRMTGRVWLYDVFKPNDTPWARLARGMTGLEDRSPPPSMPIVR